MPDESSDIWAGARRVQMTDWGLTLEPAPSWTRDALCAEVDMDMFFPEKGGSTRPAKRICQLCEVRSACLSEALERGERFGIWGGLSERERRRLERTAA